MTAAWMRFNGWVERLSLQQRVYVFIGASVLLLAIAWFAAINPLLMKQKQVAQNIKQQQTLAATMQEQIQKLAKAKATDPDADDKNRLEQLRRQVDQLRTTMLDTQKDLVPPDRMASVLEEILKRNRGLHLKSLKTLPVTSLMEPFVDRRAGAKPARPATAAPGKPGEKPSEKMELGSPSLPADAIFKHGVQVVVEGQYLEMLKYLAELEAMPSQLFWGKAELHVDEYPKATLTLTLFTLSLDKRWMGI